jgi:hypothetical protein
LKKARSDPLTAARTEPFDEGANDTLNGQLRSGVAIYGNNFEHRPVGTSVGEGRSAYLVKSKP